jgi:bifunctional non-homologous end joining protein LigD
MGETVRQASLFYKGGGSDKVYHAWLRRSDEDEAKFVVDFAFGRRGSTLNTGAKTINPVPETKAETIFDALVRSKLEKGYQYLGTTAPEYSNTVTTLEAKQTGIFPQLLNPIDDSKEYDEFVNSDEWWAQEKKDGKRLIIKRDGDEVFGINKRGLTCGVPDTITNVMRQFIGSIIVDGESIGETLYVFDLLEYHGIDIRPQSYDKRYSILKFIIHKLQEQGSDKGIILVPVFKKKTDKVGAIQQFVLDHKEGVVFKQWSAPYTAGRPASGGTQRKYKFYATASVVVSMVNSQRSVGIVVFRDEQAIGLGNVSIPVDDKVPDVGQIIEVRYLYAYKDGALAQPVYLGPRDDVAESECVESQLKYKSEEDEA